MYADSGSDRLDSPGQEAMSLWLRTHRSRLALSHEALLMPLFFLSSRRNPPRRKPHSTTTGLACGQHSSSSNSSSSSSSPSKMENADRVLSLTTLRTRRWREGAPWRSDGDEIHLDINSLVFAPSRGKGESSSSSSFIIISFPLRYSYRVRSVSSFSSFHL